MRYFVNPYPDFGPSVNCTIDSAFWKKFLLQKVSEIVSHVPCTPQSSVGGLYTGSPGVAYALWYLAKTASDDVLTQQQRQEFREQGLKYSESYFTNRKPEDPDTSFLCGAAGVHVTSALLAHDLNRADVCRQHVDAYFALGKKLLPEKFFRHGSDEMLVGRAGYLAGAFQLARIVPIAIDHHVLLKAIYDTIIASGTNYAKQHRSPMPLMYSYYDTEYLGAAHGLSGILQELLTTNYLVHGVAEPPTVRAAVDYLLSLKQSDANYAAATDELTKPRRPEDALVHWCHGASGVVYCMAMAFRRYGDAKYATAIFEAGDLMWKRGLLRKGPGICHGVAGNGYVHLLCHRLASTPEEKQKHLYRASKFCEFLVNDEFRSKAATPDNPWSLYEGWSGTICFICDLLSNPDKAEFPFSDVFSC